MPVLRYITRAGGILSMMSEKVYIIDNIPLFNPVTAGGKTLSYDEFMAGRTTLGLCTKIYFVTSDIDSITNMTMKMQNIFIQSRMPVIVLKDTKREKNITVWHLLLRLVKKRQEERDSDKLVRVVNDRMEWLEHRIVRKRYRKNSMPMYIKTTMAYGVQSGGMVAHSTGVINALAKQYGQIPVYTTDYISSEVQTRNIHHISMKAYHDFSELRNLYFNFSACREIYGLQKGREPAFVYQRYALDNFMGLQISYRYNVPFVLEFNSSEIWTSRHWGNGLKYKNLAERIENLNLDKADLIVCVSDVLKEDLTKRGIESQKILVDYNGADIEKYNPEISGKEIREKYCLQNKIVIGFCGSFGVFHGAEKLAESYAELISRDENYKRKTSLMMIGEGRTLPEVKRILKRFQIEDCVNCVGSICFEKISSYLAACDILVAPHVCNKDGSNFFGSPTKLFEYMAMGKAIAASDLGQMSKILRDGENALLFEPGNVKDMSDKLEILLRSDVLREKLGTNARKDVVENYTWDVHVRKIIEKMDEIYGG